MPTKPSGNGQRWVPGVPYEDLPEHARERIDWATTALALGIGNSSYLQEASVAPQTARHMAEFATGMTRTLSLSTLHLNLHGISRGEISDTVREIARGLEGNCSLQQMAPLHLDIYAANDLRELPRVARAIVSHPLLHHVHIMIPSSARDTGPRVKPEAVVSDSLRILASGIGSGSYYGAAGAQWAHLAYRKRLALTRKEPAPFTRN